MDNKNYHSGKSKNKYIKRTGNKEAHSLLDKYISSEKAVFLFISTMIACALPMLLGIKLWDSMPDIVKTGIIGSDGNDDSMPKAVLAFGLPGLMCVLNLICHAQLWFNQKAGKIPPTSSRLLGRWGFPILSVIFASGCTITAAGGKLMPTFVLPCAFALILMLTASHFYDCKRESRLAFHLSWIEYKTDAWRITHLIAAICWMAAGLLVLALIMYFDTVPVYSAVLVVILLIAEVPISKITASISE